MKKCTQCHVYIDSKRKTCPLCLAVLEDDGLDYIDKYPKPQFAPQKRSIFLKILAFLSIVATLACVLINILTYEKGKTFWSAIVAFNICYFWVLIKSTFKKENKVAIRLVIQTIAISLLLYGIDYFTGNLKWSVNYVIPFITIASLLSILILSIGNKERYIQNFLYILVSIILSIIPLFLWLFKLSTILWPALSSSSFGIVTLIGIGVFADKDTKEEIKKRFHI